VTYWLRKQGFILCLLAAVLLAFYWPELGRFEKAGVAKITANLAVALVFFLQGLSLATRQMLAGCRPLRLHLFVLGWNFVLFPAIAWLLSAAVSSFLGPELSMGLWMLAILPTTIASATALTVASRGAVPQAIFASIFSNLLAIFLVPLLALAYLSGTSGVEVSLVPVFTKLCLIVLWPLMFGQFLRRYFRTLSIAVSRRLHWLPQAAILYIVYLSFSQTAASGFFGALSFEQLVAASITVVFLLLLVSYWVWQSSRWMGLKKGERVTAFFCGSQKSIATGLPLLTTTLAVASIDAGLVLVPLLLYHSLQLLLGGFLVPHFASERDPD
jgi:sodium/bile acid cotransporter 7